MYPGGGPTRAGMESFGFPSHFHQTLHEFPLCKVNALLAGTLDLSEKDADGNGRSESSQETSGVSEEKNSEPQSMEVSVDPQEEVRRAERERLREQRVRFFTCIFPIMVVWLWNYFMSQELNHLFFIFLLY